MNELLYESKDWTFKVEEVAGYNGSRLVLTISHNDGGMSATINLGDRDRRLLAEAVMVGDPARRREITGRKARTAAHAA